MKRRVWVLVVLAAIGLGSVAACSGGDGDDDGLPPVEAEPSSSSSTASSTTDPAPVTTTEPESDLESLAVLWDRLWVASGKAEGEREAAVAEIADSLSPEVAEAFPQILFVPEEREVLTAPAFTPGPDGTVEIDDCVIFTPPFVGTTATHIAEGVAVPDGDGGWIIDTALWVDQGCVPAEMHDEILEDYDEFIQAFRDSGKPADAEHPSLAETMTGEYLDRVIAGTQELVDNNWYYEDFDVRNPEIVRVPGSNVVVIRDCVEFDPRGGVFEEDGSRIEGSVIAEPGERGLIEVLMRLEGGQWKAEKNEQIFDEGICETAPTPSALPRI